MKTGGLWEAAWQQVGRWLPTVNAPGDAPLDEVRFVVVDTETSGLDPRRDRLLSIGACAVQGGRIDLAATFYRELRQEEASDADNILIHGIGKDAQLSGDDRGPVLQAFLDFTQGDPLAGFTTSFDDAVLARAVRADLGESFHQEWFCLAKLPRALYPEAARRCRTLDDWLAHFGIGAIERHHALGDAYATAQFLLIVLAKARAEGYRDLAGLRSAMHAGRFAER